MKAWKIFKRRIRELPWWWHNQWRSWCLRRADLPCRLRTGIEPVFREWADWTVFNDIFVEGDYDIAIKEALEAADSAEPVLILDIGANTGFFTLRCCHLRRLERPQIRLRILQFEACASTYDRLREHMTRHGLNRAVEDVQSHFCAVGRRTGTMWIANNPFHAMTSASSGEAGGRQVSFINLDDLLSTAPVIHLLKCDIEGGESWLLEEYESLLRRTERAVFEFHLDRVNHAQCMERLERCGLQRHHVIMANQHIALEYFTRASFPQTGLAAAR